MNAITHVDESLAWSYTTMVLCLLGWSLHWLMSWAESWKTARTGIVELAMSNKPAFIMSIVGTVACYIVMPELANFAGINTAELPAGVTNLAALVTGYIADSVVYKLANMAKRVQ